MGGRGRFGAGRGFEGFDFDALVANFEDGELGGAAGGSESDLVAFGRLH